MTKVLAVFGHRPEKVANILPYSGLEFEMATPVRRAGRRKIWKPWKPDLFSGHPLVRLAVLIPNTLNVLLSPKPKNVARELIKSYNPDIVFTHGGGAAHALMTETRKAHKKFVMRLGGHPYEEFRDNMKVPGWSRLAMTPVHGTHYWFLINNMKAANHIIVVAEDMKRRLVERYGYADTKVSVVPVPINHSKFAGELIPHEDKVILTIANVNFLPKVRAVMDYCEGMLDILKRNPDVRWKLIIPGRYGEILKHRLSNVATEQIEILGHVDDVKTAYKSSDIVVYLSYLDSVPNIVLEAWASGIPVIANQCEWSNELIQDSKTGLLVDSPTLLAYYIKALLQSTKLQKELAHNGYQYILQHHTEEIAGRRLGEVLRAI